MPISGMPSPGPSLPAGCTNVKVKTTGADPNASNNKLDVTTLSDAERVYAAAPLNDPGPASDGGSTITVTCSFIGSAPTVTAMATTSGWICTEVETEYAVGEFVKGTATYVFVPEEE